MSQARQYEILSQQETGETSGKEQQRGLSRDRAESRSRSRTRMLRLDLPEEGLRSIARAPLGPAPKAPLPEPENERRHPELPSLDWVREKQAKLKEGAKR